jgi:hypothetical protein
MDGGRSQAFRSHSFLISFSTSAGALTGAAGFGDSSLGKEFRGPLSENVLQELEEAAQRFGRVGRHFHKRVSAVRSGIRALSEPPVRPRKGGSSLRVDKSVSLTFGPQPEQIPTRITRTLEPYTFSLSPA